VRDSVLGERVASPDDIARIGAGVRRRSFDLLQADHTLSGIDIALWDLLGKSRGEPVWRLLGFDRAWPKEPYASALFADDPPGTYAKARAIRADGYRAAKFGWGPYGAAGIEADGELVAAAREGLGDGALLMVDAGTVWGEDVEAAAARLPALERHRVFWLEEPFVKGALGAYRELARRSPRVPLAGGEGSSDVHSARHMIDYGGVRFIQIDAGRAGGITAAHDVARHAAARGVTFVNHTFTTQLALCASIQPYAGLEAFEICEYPTEPTPLARDLFPPLERDGRGRVLLPERPGLGMEPRLDVLRRHVVEVEIRAGGRTLYTTPDL
jgi:L-alanine-DL-glutamate epimerase-like enolase superfamily enzyme